MAASGTNATSEGCLWRWPYSFGLYWLMPASGFVGVVAVSLCVLTLALGWSELRPRSLGVLSVALCLSAALVYVPWQYSRLRSTLPSIHDITTDTDNPPAFSDVLLGSIHPPDTGVPA